MRVLGGGCSIPGLASGSQNVRMETTGQRWSSDVATAASRGSVNIGCNETRCPTITGANVTPKKNNRTKFTEWRTVWTVRTAITLHTSKPFSILMSNVVPMISDLRAYTPQALNSNPLTAYLLSKASTSGMTEAIFPICYLGYIH